MKNGLLGILCLAAFAAVTAQFCVKPPDYPIEPVIEFKSVSKSVMRQRGLAPNNPDSILVTFSYTDGDGDLGYPDSDPTTSIFFKDGRDQFGSERKLPYVDPQGAGNGISGEISVMLPSTCCIDTTGDIPTACQSVSITTDTLVYLITIRDRAGHVSNEIKTSPIVLICKQ
ncbi:MAG: hypothetical protein IT262_07780 [Saprospiraceae bacterium]|nr:hypothetical protein [Saprospiraceae bacterium]